MQRNMLLILSNLFKDCLSKQIDNVTLLAIKDTFDSKIYNMYFDKIFINYTKENKFNEIRKFIEIVKQNKIDKNAMDEFYDFVEFFLVKI